MKLAFIRMYNKLKALKVGEMPIFFFLAIAAYFVLTKLPLLISGVIPFTFDHGKDSIAIFHMWQTLSPKLIGPWTSIPGLFFGPAWYYLLLPAYVLGLGHPVAPVWLMVLLGVLQIWIAARYFGSTAAILVASSQTWFTLSQSAWNPFPMTLVTFVLLVLFKQISLLKSITRVQAVTLGFTAALGFHFSTAFAIFYPILIAAFFVIRKIKISFISFLFIISGFMVPFVPQLLFEVTHDFLEVKAVITYLTKGDSQAASGSKLIDVLHVTLEEAKLSVVPVTHFSIPYLTISLQFLTLIAYAYGLYKALYLKKKIFFGKDFFFWFILPTLGFTFLHFNVWYILGFLPVVLIICAQLIDQLPQQIKKALLLIFLITPALKVIFYYTNDQVTLNGSRQFLPVKRAALDFIRADANGRAFASYHYVPDIYDYSYQYLYFWQANLGKPLPTEFSYKPGADAYIPEKSELLDKFGRTSKKPEVIYYVVEKTQNPAFLETWWNEQSYEKIISEHAISEEVKVYVAIPKKQ